MSELLHALSPVQRHAGGVHVLHVRMAPGTRMDGHGHDHPTLVIVLRGQLVVVEGAGTFDEAELTIRVSARATRRTVSAPEGADCLIISFDPRHIVARHELWRRASTRTGRYVAGATAQRVIMKIVNASTSTSSLDCLCLELLTELLREDNGRAVPPPWLERALTGLSMSAGRKGTCSAVARDLGLHPVHLARVVRRFTGLTARDYIRHERIVRATQVLRATERPLSRIAHDTGFADHSHFTREFVYRFGHAPSSDAEKQSPDVVSIQAPEFPATQVGRLSSR